MGVDPNADALRVLSAGALPAREISARVGWAPRSAGSRLRSMEMQKLVRSRVAVGDDGKEMVVWALTEKGATIALPKEPPGIGGGGDEEQQHEQHDDDRGEDQRDEPHDDQLQDQQYDQQHDQQQDDQTAVDDGGPWPTLRAREGGIDPSLSPAASLSGWIFVLEAAHYGASSGSAAKRRVIETHIRSLEQQLEITWKHGRYEDKHGVTITPGKLQFLKQRG